MFDRLSLAQRDLAGDRTIQVNEIYILDSPAINAFVVSQKQSGIGRSENQVFLTTGIIRRMFEDANGKPASSQADLKLGMSRIAGVLSHELGHPLDKIDPEGFEKNYAKRMVSQAAEIRADSEGSEIASRAGYPRGSVYEGLKSIFRDSKKQSLLGAAASTHPDNDLRLTTQRLLMTYQRLGRGAEHPRYPETVKSNLLKELGTLDKYNKQFMFVEPQSTDETLSRIGALVQARNQERVSEPSPYQVLEFNRLLLMLDYLVFERSRADGGTFTNDEFHRLVDLTNAQQLFPILRKDEFATVFTDETGSAELRALPDHYDFLGFSPAYNHPEYGRAVMNIYPIDPNSYHFPMEFGRRALLVGPNLIVNAYGPDLITWFQREARDPSRLRHSWDDLASQLDPVAQIHLANFYHDKLAALLDPVARAAFESGLNISSHYSYTIPSVDRPSNPDKKTGRAMGVIDARFRIMGDRRKSPLHDEVRRLMQSIWNRRGYYGVLDLVRSSGNYDWEAIWSVLGIDPKVGRDQLKSAVKAFTQTPEYGSLLQTIVDDSGAVRRGMDVSANGGYAIHKKTPLTWPDTSLWRYLAGELNPSVKADPARRKAAQQGIAASYLVQNPALWAQMIRTQLKANLDAWGARPPTLTELENTIQSVSNATGTWMLSHKDNLLLLTQAIDGSKLPVASRQALLRDLLYPRQPGPRPSQHLSSDPVLNWASSHPNEILEILHKNGIVDSAFGVLDRLIVDRKTWETANSSVNRADPSWQRSYFKVAASLRDELLKEIPSTRSPQELLALAQILNPAEGRYSDDIFANRREHAAIKAAFIQQSTHWSLTPIQKRALFDDLTATGGTAATDAYFASFDDRLRRPLDSRIHTNLEQLLKRGRIAGANLQMAMADKILRGRIESLAQHLPVSDAELSQLIGTLNELVPSGSLRKDDWLESLAWKLQLEGSQLESFVTDEKSTNWKKANPLTANMGSVLSRQLAHLTPDSREQLTKFLVNPDEGTLPASLAGEIEAGMVQAALASKKPYDDDNSVRSKAREAASNAFTKLEVSLREASPTEKIPLLELMLTSGEDAPVTSDGFPTNIVRTYLKYPAGSRQEKLLLSYLRVIPPHEAAVTLSYLMSQAGQDKGSIKSMFEVFQTVGIKFGQMSSIWNLFGKEIAHETASLRDNAKPMAKSEVESVLAATLSPEERAQIKSLDRVLGSASMKTVVQATLHNGQTVVLLVQRPYTPEQIAGNLDLAERFVADLRENQVDIPTSMFQSIIANVRAQLDNEMHMTREAEAIRKAQTHYAKLNQTLKRELNGWHFEVPGLVDGFRPRDNLLVIEKADGKSWSSLPPEIRKAVGAPIVDATLEGIFREGWFDADRHTGNVLVNHQRKAIQPIDFGQAEEFDRQAPWKADDGFHLAQFLRYLHEKKPKELVEYAKRMSTQPTQSLKNKDSLLKDVQNALASSNGHDQMINVMHALSDGGVELDRRFGFGALKTLMTLHGEGYVTPEKFQTSLASRATSKILSKAPLLLKEKIQSTCQGLMERLSTRTAN
jgi:predicted unusual protein kinase regulating ubiquinone biosynthesis (AarF/ABC1/UbiB family)